MAVPAAERISIHYSNHTQLNYTLKLGSPIPIYEGCSSSDINLPRIVAVIEFLKISTLPGSSIEEAYEGRLPAL